MKKLLSNPFVSFLPFLGLYALVVAVGHKDVLEGDEGRYYLYAQNLLHGYYSPVGEVFLWNGPGYPLILVPMVAMGLPLVYSSLLNALFQYISVVFLYRTLVLFAKKRTAIFFTLLWACYYPAYKELTGMFTEPFSNMLVCLFLYYASLAFLLQKRKPVILSGILLGYLTLTKIIFGYIILALLVILLLAWLVRRTRRVQRAAWIVAIALLVNVPYLLYTWNLTGKMFYWATSGGMSLYWASTPVKEEFGDWNDDHFTAYCGVYEDSSCNAALFAKNHQADYDSIYQYQGLQRDDAFRKIAIRNIREHPGKYLRNCIANAGRLFFNMPYSYNYHRMQNLWRIPAGALVLCMILFSFLVSLINLRRLPFVIIFFAFFLFLYLGTSVLVSAYQRFLTVAVPVIIVYTAYLFDRTVSFRYRIPEE